MSKYKIIMLFFLTIGLIIFGNIKAKETLYGKCIYIDSGHGGY